MPHGNPAEDLLQSIVPKRKTPKQECQEGGGVWNEETQTCQRKSDRPKPTGSPSVAEVRASQEKLRQEQQGVETFTSSETGRASGVTLPDGRTFFGLSPEDVATIAAGEQARVARPEGTAPVGTAAGIARARQEGQQLAGQIGEFDPLAISPTGLDTPEAIITGIVDSVPSAIRLGAQLGTGAAALGAVATAPAGGVGAIPAAVIGGAAGFTAGLVSGITSSFKGQRRDTTTAQQKVLDEGKQTMQEWATMAKSDPSNKARYLSEFNKVSAQIDQAYRQMKLDTIEDSAKFETSTPNLAEFETFYSEAGERDALNQEMRIALTTVTPESYALLELANRRGML